MNFLGKLKAKPCRALFFLPVVPLLFSGSPAACRGNLTDEEKLKITYDMYDRYKRDFPGALDISAAEARELSRRGKALFIDTRTRKEMEVSMLPGAVTEEEFIGHREKYRHLVPIAYCTISYRSGVFSEKQSGGDPPVRNLRGGLLAWVLEGGAVHDKNGKAVKIIHVYGRRWDYPPAGYRSVY